MTTSKKVISLQFAYEECAFENNFKKLSSYIKKAPSNSLVVAPELVISNFCYQKMDKAADYFENVKDKLLYLSKNKTVIFSATVKENGKFYNRAFIFHDKKIVYQRDKYELFKLGDEHKHFSRGNLEDIKIVDIGGIRYAILICFEIRFINLWERLKGADIILVPALWGKPRKKQLHIIANSLSVINQCFVVVSDSANKDMAKNSLISTPFGDIYKDDRKNSIEIDIDLAEIRKMRRYLNVGIK